jgi:BT1 family
MRCPFWGSRANSGESLKQSPPPVLSAEVNIGTGSRLARTTRFVRRQLEAAVLTPVRALRWRYLPLLMIYFAYGALGITAIASAFWVKQGLLLTPSDLAALGVWLSLPWAMKMVFGELVDAVPVFGSRRRVYVFIGAALIALGLLMLAGAASGRLTFASADALYVAASLIMVVGVVLQDVVADAMSTEVVQRFDADGSPRPIADVERDLGMVQVLGRLAISLGIFAVAGLGGWLAQTYSYATVFLIGLAVPAFSVSGALLVKLEPGETRKLDRSILFGGLAFGLVVVLIGSSGWAWSQELVFAVSLAVIIVMLRRTTGALSKERRRQIALAALLIFIFRAMPSVGEGFTWFSIDVLGFGEGFFGLLQQTGAAIGLVALWLLSDAVTKQPVERVLLWLTVVGSALMLPNLVLAFEWHRWTEAAFGLGARSIAIIDAAASSPLAQISMIPLLTLIAINAPAGQRATWFALMASLMNLALVAGSLATKHLNIAFGIDKGAYGQLPALVSVVAVVGLIVPLAAVLWFGPELRNGRKDRSANA